MLRADLTMLTATERARYSRHLLLPEIGEEGQEKLKSGSVLIIGAGGLGSPAATYLAAAGVGRIGLVDFDRVDRTNLHRQILFTDSSVGHSKTEAGRARLLDLNPDIEVVAHDLRLTSENALELLARYDVVLDGTDNFATRYLINDAAVLTGKPNVYGSIFRFEGQASVFGAAEGPCYRCLYPEPPPPHLVPSCAEAGVLGVLPGIIGTIQAVEAIKLITGRGTSLAGRLLLFDALAMRFREMRIARNPDCSVCGVRPTITHLIDYEEFCSPVHDTEITPAQLAQRIAAGDEIVLVDVREPYEWNAGHLPGALHLPMQQVPQRLEELPRDREIVMICRSGSRSANVQRFLEQSGYSRVLNLTGGMIRWAREVDPTVRVV